MEMSAIWTINATDKLHLTTNVAQKTRVGEYHEYKRSVLDVLYLIQIF